MTHLDDLRDTLTHARLCYEAWWVFEEQNPNRKEIVWVYNRYAGLFGTVHPALFSTFLVKLASVFGTRTDEISLQRIAGIDQIAEFAGVWGRGRLFHKYRSKVIAHRDVNVTHQTFVPESGCATYNDLKKLLDDTCEVFEAAAKKQNVEGLPPFTSADDLLELVLDLAKHHNASL